MKKILHWSGSILGVAGVVFVIFKLMEYSDQLNISRFTVWDALAIFFLTIVYSVSVTLLAMAWRLLLKNTTVEVSAFCSIRMFGISQLAKYIPGNIIHLASRQSLGMAFGIPGWSLAKTSVWELSLVSISAGFFCLLLLPIYIPSVSDAWVLIIFACVVALAILLVAKFVNIYIAKAVALYVAFFILAGLIFAVLIALVMGVNAGSLHTVMLLCGAFVVSLLVGMVTPGAPAGVGVRELVLVLLLNGLIPEADMLLAVLVSRIITVGGDLLFFVFAYLVKCKEVSPR